MKLRYILYTLLAAAILSGCKRQHICTTGLDTDSAKIEVSIDWSESNIDIEDIYNVSIYAYTDDGSAPYIYVSSKINGFYLYLPEGDYTLLIFNDFVGDLRGIDFKESDSYELFSAGVVEQSSVDNLFYQVASDEIIAQEPAMLAVWRMEGLEVTPEMTSCSYCDDEVETEADITLEATPTSVTTQCIIDLSIDNLNNASYIEATIQGFATGVYLSSGDRFSDSDYSVLFSTELDSRTYGNDSDGTADGETTTFGIDTNLDQSYEVEIDIILNSGELATFTRDVTDQITTLDDGSIYINLTAEESKITLPSSVSSGFGVESWDDNEQVAIY